jgi:beta-galactosidase
VRYLLILLSALFLSLGVHAETLCFDFDWQFSRDSIGWQTVQLPHDWNIFDTFVEGREANGSAAGLPDGIGWYQKRFAAPKAWQDRRVSILFDGIFQRSEVWLNGHFLGYRPYGYCSIEYDLTPYLQSDNLLVVKCNTGGGRPRWYAGAGIYRHVRLNVCQPVHLLTYGNYVTTPKVEPGEAEVSVRSSIVNTSDKAQKVSVTWQVLDASGRKVGRTASSLREISAGQTVELDGTLSIADPHLWNGMAAPYLYQLQTVVKAGGRTVDQRTTSFGVRTIAFDSNRGFLLNDEPLKLKGLCLHSEAGSLGAAVPDASYLRRLRILKEYGCNAIRCAHNQPSSEFLDMCDSLGFVVIDEAFDKWKSGYYEQHFDAWWQRDLADMILRDRNHPSVILWSIGNELQEAWDDSTNVGVDRARMLQDFVHRLEPTRPVVLAAQNNHQAKFAGVTDVIGYNYLEARMISEHQIYPERCMLVTEELPYYCGAEGNIRAYSTVNPWNYVAANDFIAGGFIWSGVDYLGEAVLPSKGWPNGLFDICMGEKPRAAYHRAVWSPERPMVRIAAYDPSLDIDHGRDLWQWPNIAAHWNFPRSYMGMVFQVQTITNCESVELVQNGKVMGRHFTRDYPNNTIVWNIPYLPGKLEARGYNGEEQVAYYSIETTGEVSTFALLPDFTEIKADGQDMSHIWVELHDKEGRLVQTDDRNVKVTVTGAGRLLAVDSGELRRKHTFWQNPVKTSWGKAIIMVQSSRTPGSIEVKVEVDGCEAQIMTIRTK